MLFVVTRRRIDGILADIPRFADAVTAKMIVLRRMPVPSIRP
jgi:hypothetical protein